MLAHDAVHGHYMGANSRKLLQQCAHLVPGPGHRRAITTTCAKRGSGTTSISSPGFLGTTWETGKLPKSVRAFEPNNMESGLVRGASVVSRMPCDYLECQIHCPVRISDVPGLQMWADNQALKLQRRAHIIWDNGGPKTVFIVKKTGSAKTTSKLKEIAQW